MKIKGNDGASHPLPGSKLAEVKDMGRGRGSKVRDKMREQAISDALHGTKQHPQGN
jgi:hypothetical protein